MTTQRPKSIDEALRVLDEALAHPTADLKNIVTDEYQNLQSALGKSGSQVSDVVGGLAGSLKSTFESSIQNLTTNLGDMTGESSEKFQAMAEQGVAMGRDVARRADEEVRANPWPYIGGIAVGTFALGVLLGSKFNASEKSSQKTPPNQPPKPDTSNLN